MVFVGVGTAVCVPVRIAVAVGELVGIMVFVGVGTAVCVAARVAVAVGELVGIIETAKWAAIAVVAFICSSQ